MDTMEYLELSAKTAPVQERMLDRMEMDRLHAAMGVASEAGELVDIFKKHIFYQAPIKPEDVIFEIGDILWYLAILLRDLDVTFEQVMEVNIEKLALRYPGQFFDARAARTRSDDNNEDRSIVQRILDGDNSWYEENFEDDD